MKNKKKQFMTLLEFLVFTLIMAFIVLELIETSYAAMSPEKATIVITIDKNGQISQAGNLFLDELWYPGEKGKDGVIRIVNYYRDTKIRSVGVTVKLNKFMTGYMEDNIYKSFLNNMRLSIEKGSTLEFEEAVIIQDKCFADLVNDITLDQNDQINIQVGNFVDLKYTLSMNKEAGNELQHLSAEVAFTIRTSIEDDSGTNHHSDENGAREILGDGIVVLPVVEEPIMQIPDLNGHWAHECIVTLYKEKIIQGDENGNIYPDHNITRAEAAVLVGKALKLEPKNTIISKYIDPIPKWASGYINISSEREIFKGYPFRWFRPNNNITREEMIKVLTRAFELSIDDKSLSLDFKDKNDISYWALENVKVGFEDKAISGYAGNTYKPNNKITRAEAFTII